MNWEISFLEFLQTAFSGGMLDSVMIFFSSLGNYGLLWIVAALIMLPFKTWRKTGVTMLLALLIGFLIGNLCMKPLIARIRPFENFENFKLLIAAPTDFSFPSGHTLSSFAAAVSLLINKRRIGIFALVVAFIIAFSRMYLLVHYPTDILAGMAIGIICAFVSRYLVNKIKKL